LEPQLEPHNLTHTGAGDVGPGVGDTPGICNTLTPSGAALSNKLPLQGTRQLVPLGCQLSCVRHEINTEGLLQVLSHLVGVMHQELDTLPISHLLDQFVSDAVLRRQI
jgi:hypothetical protein